MDFVTRLPILINRKGEYYDSILVIVDWLTKMVRYKSVKISIDASRVAKVIIDVIIWHNSLFDSIVTDQGSVFTSKFQSSLYYFLSIKQRLLTTFHPQTDGQAKKQNSIIETYLRIIVNFELNNWVRYLPRAKFAYNNAKNASTGHTPFELNCGYHSRISYKDDINSQSKSKSADKLSEELRKLMIICQGNFYHIQKF